MPQRYSITESLLSSTSPIAVKSPDVTGLTVIGARKVLAIIHCIQAFESFVMIPIIKRSSPQKKDPWSQCNSRLEKSCVHQTPSNTE
jgi:hypothetical protein